MTDATYFQTDLIIPPQKKSVQGGSFSHTIICCRLAIPQLASPLLSLAFTVCWDCNFSASLTCMQLNVVELLWIRSSWKSNTHKTSQEKPSFYSDLTCGLLDLFLFDFCWDIKDMNYEEPPSELKTCRIFPTIVCLGHSIIFFIFFIFFLVSMPKGLKRIKQTHT